jgi:hypothetical protein
MPLAVDNIVSVTPLTNVLASSNMLTDAAVVG